MATEHATLLLNKQLKELTKHPVEGFSAGLVDDNNIFEWEIMIMGPRDTLYEGGFFRAIMTFPPEYPLLPPKLRFTTDIYHPNGRITHGQHLIPWKSGGITNGRITNGRTNTCSIASSRLVYPDGEVCISILHPPGEDKYGYEQASERWLPVHTVETILISVISMLSSPNDESPANIEAAKEWRNDYSSYKKKVQRITRRSAEDM